MAVCCDGKGFATKLLSGARIKDAMEVLKGHATKRQRPFHVYVSFISDDRKLIGKCVDAGKIE